MDNPEALVTLGTQDIERRLINHKNTTQHNTENLKMSNRDQKPRDNIYVD